MRKIFALFVLSVLTTGLFGQPMITSDVLIPVGEAEATTYVDFVSHPFNSGPSGTMQEWMFANLPASINTCQDEAQNPDGSAFRDSFPSATVYFVCNTKSQDGEETENHAFYRVNGNDYEFLGNVAVSITDPDFDSIFVVYKDPILWARFPYTYLSEATDDFRVNITAYIGAQKIVSNQEGTIHHLVDGYGSVETPSGVFMNALRVKRTELAKNSIPGIPVTTDQETHRYTWYAEGERGVILNLDSIVVKDFTGNVVNTTYAGNYRMRGPMASSLLKVEESSELHLFPSPAKDRVFIAIDEGVPGPHVIKIFNGWGSEIGRRVYALSGQTFEVDLIGLRPGPYFIVIQNPSGEQHTKKLIKMD